MGSSTLTAMLKLCLLPLVTASYVLRPEGFIKLPTHTGAQTFLAGTANKASYDPVSNLLYVVGHNADVLNVVNMKDSLTNPVHARTIRFDALNQGLPNDVKVCRGSGPAFEFLAISFESKDLSERGHVHFYQLLDQPNDAFIRLKTVVTVEGFDPLSMAWNSGCTELIAVSKGAAHTINGVFEDPKPTVDVLVPKIGLNVDRRSIPFSESSVKSSGIRQIFSKCDSGSHTAQSTHVQDLEPTHVTVDSNNIAYLLFQSNNAIGRMDLTDPFAPMTYHTLDLKDWSQYGLDTSYEDGGMKQYRHSIKSLYQPGHAVTFSMGGHTWIATADGGQIKNYNVRVGSTTLCKFDESAVGASWRSSNSFSSALSPNVATELMTNLSSNARIGRMNFCRLKSIQDGYNPLQMGYNYLSTYGGRGWSLIDATNAQRVYDSGDLMESYFMSADAKDAEKAVYNSYYVNANQPQSQYTDRTSNTFGPNPTAIATGDMNGTQVVVVANGNMGGLYTFSVEMDANSTVPAVSFEGYVRRGSPGLTWTDAFKRTDDAVGEPGITDLLWISDEGQNVVVAISSIAGVASFYSVEMQP